MINSIGNQVDTTAALAGKPSTTSASGRSLSFQDVLSDITTNDKVTLTAAEVNKNDFAEWKTDYFTKGIGDDRRIQVENDSASFEQIIDKAVATGGYYDPQKFLNNLSTEELAVLQHIHCLADPIKPQGLSKEGALNLLYSPDQSKDINNDGLSDVGLAKMWKYPPPNAPEAVKKAWKEATAGRDDLLLMAPFRAAESNANMKPDGSGFYFPGEQGYRNIYSEPGFSYSQQITDIFKSWEQLKPSYYTEVKGFLDTYLDSLKKYHAGWAQQP
jgi:hypothetical protein